MIILNDDKSLCMLLKKPRSKWYVLCCIGSKKHYRKDGGCKHIDELLPYIREDVRPRVRIDPFGGKATNPPIGD